MTSSTPHSPVPEVELDPAAEHLTRHVSTVTSTALAATQHAMQSATLRAYLARDAASAEARVSQRALQSQQQLTRTAEVTDRAAARAGIAPTTASDPAATSEPAAPSAQWTAYADGAEAAALGGRGVSTPPAQVLTHLDAHRRASGPPPGVAADLDTGLSAPEQDTALGHGISTVINIGTGTGIEATLATPTPTSTPTPGVEP